MVAILALLTVWLVLPFAARWEEREATISAKALQLGQLRGLVSNDGARQKDLAAREVERDSNQARLLTGATPALAASDLQALLQGYADASRVTLDRVDVVAETGDTGKVVPAIPVRLSGQGDIYGLTELVSRLQHGGKLLIIDELGVTGGNPGYAPDLLTFSMRLHGAYRAE